MRIIFTLLLAMLIGGTAEAADTYSTKDSPALGVGEVSDANPFAGLFFGVNVGGQFTSIAISADGFDEAFDGLANDGFVGGGHVGFNFCPRSAKVCLGAQLEGGWSNGETTFADVDLLKFDDYVQLTAQVLMMVGRSTAIDLHGGYEWQSWTVGDSAIGFETDADVGMWVVGIGLQTLIAEQTSFGIKFDYLMLDSAEADGFDAGDALEDTEALRVQARLTYYPTVNLPTLESVRW